MWGGRRVEHGLAWMDRGESGKIGGASGQGRPLQKSRDGARRTQAGDIIPLLSLTIQLIFASGDPAGGNRLPYLLSGFDKQDLKRILVYSYVASPPSPPEAFFGDAE